jgi:hypothetical protein
MSSCAIKRWGPGTCKEKIPDTQATKELSERLEQMKQQRSADMNVWTSKPVSTINPYINGNRP